MTHMGGTLRRLRLESGLSLRDLARRLGVSSAYLSRVEHGLDPSPTTERLASFASELGVPADWLLEVGHRLAPALDRYVEQEPRAAALFAAIARRELDAEALADIQRYVERRFPAVDRAPRTAAHHLARLLEPERVITGVRCAELDDAYEIACARVAGILEAHVDPADLAALARDRAAQSDPHIGGGIAVVSIAVPRSAPTAAVVILARPVSSGALDGLPVSIAVLLIGPTRSREMMLRVTQVARLASRGLVEALSGARTGHDALRWIQALEEIG